MSQIVINGDNIELLKNYPDNYFDAVVTDPPYGLGKEPNAQELMKDWVEKGYHEISGKGFMGKEWDAFIPQPIFWREVYRVLKHGGHVLSFFGTRTYDWGVMSMRFAGFEVRDCIQWLYGSGFPKSHNIGKAIDKIEGNERKVVGELKNKVNLNATKEGDKSFYESAWQNKEYIDVPITKGDSQWEGWGSALKPANEPIVLARKPLEKGLSIAENILKWGVGGINIDASRISGGAKKWETPRGGIWMTNSEAKSELIDNPKGRFPANIILTHHEDCECKGTKKVKPSNSSGKASEKGGGFSKGMFGDGTSDNIGGGFTDADGNETIEDWDCHEDCPIRILDEKSGVSKSGDIKTYKQKNIDSYNGSMPTIKEVNFKGDKGGASRFFYVAKASKAERNKGLDNSNFHPTVKPIKLMQYLVKMITPPNGIVLDPFCGSGTTGVACKLDGFQFVGLEQDPEYAKIAEARINNYIQNAKEYQGVIQESKEPLINKDDNEQLALF